MAKSKAVATASSTAIADIDAQLSNQVADIQSQIGAPSSNRIRMSNNLFNFPDGSSEKGPVDLVVLDFVSRNEYYDTAYDANNPQAPACFAIGKRPSELQPSPNCTDAQSTNCAECPLNQFGSAGKGKACKNTRYLAVMRADDDPETGDIMTLSVPPSAIKAFDGYVSTVAKMFNSVPLKVITSVSFHPDKTYTYPLFSDPQPNPDYAKHFARKVEANVLLEAEPEVPAAPVKAAPRRRAAGGRGRK